MTRIPSLQGRNDARLFPWLVLLTMALICLGATQSKQRTREEQIDHGRFLVQLGGCTDCHTPKVMTSRGPADDPKRYLAGHPAEVVLPPPPVLPEGPWNAITAGLTAWSGPWGITYAPNLTPDEHTGLGIWTEDMFVNAIRTGKHMATSRPILPPMPWPVYRNMTDDDLKSVFAYLRTVPGIANRIPDPVIAPPPPGAP
jgi:hypothetical protein